MGKKRSAKKRKRGAATPLVHVNSNGDDEQRNYTTKPKNDDAHIAQATKKLKRSVVESSSSTTKNVNDIGQKNQQVKANLKTKKKNKKKSSNLITKQQDQNSLSTPSTTPKVPGDAKQKQPISSTTSLASKLKKLRGTAATTPPPPEWSRQSHKLYLTPNDDDGDDFNHCLDQCYKGFHWEEPKNLPSSLHKSFESSFDTLNKSKLFLYDIVQPGGKRLSKTMVTRTLVGCPGSTYKYLGLRLFSHPWCDVDDNGDALLGNDKKGSTLVKLGYNKNCASSLIEIGKVNDTLVQRTKTVLEEQIAPTVPNGLVGSADYTLTLINKMEPTSVKHDLKDEKNAFGLHGGKTSVSWHKDSGLQDFSSIAVYHTLLEGYNGDDDVDDRRQKKNEVPWRVALRIANASNVSSNTTTPALSVPLPSGSLYYLLDDFNHIREHAVLAGSNQLRYSSTHRVAKQGCGTWQYLCDKCDSIVSSSTIISLDSNAKTKETCTSGSSKKKKKSLIKEVRSHQHLMTEIEFEWLRQWYIQGQKHAKLHPYWHKPMEQLMESFKKLERLSLAVIQMLKDSSEGKTTTTTRVCDDLFDVVIEGVEERMRLRAVWHERLRDPIFSSLPPDERPFDCPVLDRVMTDVKNNEMTEDLGSLIKNLRSWRSSFVDQKKEEGSSGGKHDKSMTKKKNLKKSSSLTKKEQRKVASNWKNMQSMMGKR